MTHTGAGTGEIPRLGARPARGSSSGCSTCRHPVAMHSNGKTACKAFACTAGPDHGPCQQFTTAGAADGVPERAAS